MSDFIQHSKPWITKEDSAEVLKVLSSGMIAEGDLTRNFEAKVSKYLQIKSSIACSSGTSALVLALHSLDIGNDSEVILPSYVCKNVYEAVVTVGATPILCDIGENWVIDVDKVKPLISKKTSAIIAVHMFGLPVDVKSIKNLNIPIVEDACQAFGMISRGVKAGSLGDIGVFSFHATKCLTTGEGGMLNTNNADILTRLNRLIKDNNSLKSVITTPMSDLQAALGIAQLKRYHRFLEKRKFIKKVFIEELQDHLPIKKVILDAKYLFRFPLYLEGYNRDKIIKALFKKKIIARLGVDRAIHNELGLDNSDFPNTASAINNTLSIPFYPSLSESNIARIIETMKRL